MQRKQSQINRLEPGNGELVKQLLDTGSGWCLGAQINTWMASEFINYEFAFAVFWLALGTVFFTIFASFLPVVQFTTMLAS